MGHYYDKSKKTALPCETDDLVMLNGKYGRTRRAAKEPDAQLLGPFKVIKLVDRSGMLVVLVLPKHWHVYNVLHITLLEPYHTSAKGLHPLPIYITDSRYVN